MLRPILSLTLAAMVCTSCVSDPVFVVRKLNHEYVPDSLQQVSHLDDEDPANRPGVHIELKYPVLSGGIDQEVILLINKSLDSVALSIASVGPDLALGDDLKSWDRDYDSYLAYIREENPGEAMQYFGWYVKVLGEVVPALPGYLAFVLKYETFTGGAHGNYGERYLMYRKSDGSQVNLGELLTEPGSFKTLRDVAWQEFTRQRELEEPGSVQADGSVAGFFVGSTDFDVSVNWLIRPQGMKLYYSPYELGPWSAGAIEIEIPAASLRGVIQGF